MFNLKSEHLLLTEFLTHLFVRVFWLEISKLNVPCFRPLIITIAAAQCISFGILRYSAFSSILDICFFHKSKMLIRHTRCLLTTPSLLKLLSDPKGFQ